MPKTSKKQSSGREHGEPSRQINSRFPKFTEEELAAPRHPFWAKGAAIGHFYRLKSIKTKSSGEVKEKRIKKADCIPLELSEKKQQQIYNILSKVTTQTPPSITKLRADGQKTCQTDEEKYKHIEESTFKKNFLNSIGGLMSEIISHSEYTTDMNRDAQKDWMYMEQEKYKATSTKYQEMQKFRKKLPAMSKKFEIIKHLKTNNVLLISGETGCGKTTQVPQFILEDNIENANGSMTHIICTQPRRISAISIAARVADERGEKLGDSVGYQIRLERSLPRKSGSILFVTTGVLLQFMRSDPLLKKVSHVILDEIHERDTLSDMVITLLKDIIPARPDLKVILMSATLNADQFSKYFNNCPTINIPGFTYPVKEYYLEDVIEMLRFQYSTKRNKQRKAKKTELEETKLLGPFYRNIAGKYSKQTIENLMMPESSEINNKLIIALLTHICQNKGPGAILVFLPGWEKIKSLNREMTESGKFPSSRYVIIPLHSLMPTVNQRTIFDRPPAGMRKIILSTNIAETSITIDDVVFVINCGKIKVKNFDIKNNVLTLKEEWISCANAKQRKGRAGRVQEGICYHLYISVRENFFAAYQLPEMLRIRLEEVILQAKILQLGKIAPFLAKVMDPPNPDAVELSLELLTSMNALDEDEKLTPLGFHLANLPVDPHTGKMILLASMFSCIDTMYSIAASLSFKDAYYIPMGREEDVYNIKKNFDSGQKSDHLSMAKVIHLWENEKRSSWESAKHFCYRNFLSHNILEQLQELKFQFAKLMCDMNYLSTSNVKAPESNKNSKNLALIKALLCGSLYPNVAVITKLKKVRTKILTTVRLPENNQKVIIHPKSVNDSYESFESRFLVYYEKMRCLNSTFLFDTSMIFPLPLIFFCEKFSVEDEGELRIIEINPNIRFICHSSLAKLIIELRAWLDWLLEYKLSHPGVTNWSTSNDEHYILSAITELITTEHEMYVNYDDEDDDDDDDGLLTQWHQFSINT
ncbi:ATP-dependent RNA helicase DHX36-like [Cimex lectularius]|uniref:RNA helicase n=1 Tax=Cimex lectularius TaxID=79782 RepID=A0A8I6RAU6_CIMLE|nr:ATP-dependent RNA helicase DHX36-like [Cimex lectularius]